jgi:hypothetical protein
MLLCKGHVIASAEVMIPGAGTAAPRFEQCLLHQRMCLPVLLHLLQLLVAIQPAQMLWQSARRRS